MRTFSCALVLFLASTTAHAQDAPASLAESETEGAPSGDATRSAERADAERADQSADNADADAESTGAENAESTDAESTDAESTDAESTDAEDADAERTDQSADTASTDAQSADAQSTDAETSSAQPPKVAVIVSGDPDPSLRAAARRVERALDGQLRMPFDPGLRAALRGEPGAEDDGLEAVRRERRRLGFEESRDAPVLATLGRRAGASAVAVVRAGDGGPELVVLDIQNGAFYEGALPLLGQPSSPRIAEFVARRARISARGARIAAPAPVAAPAAATAPDAPEEPEEQPDFFEQFWPYLVAGVLLAGMITAIAITSTTAGSEQPVLRFVPGGR